MWVGGGHSLLPGEGMSELHFKIKKGIERKRERRDNPQRRKGKAETPDRRVEYVVRNINRFVLVGA